MPAPDRKPFSALPERMACTLDGHETVIGFAWLAPSDLELSEGTLLDGKRVPRGLGAAVKDWEARGVPPLFADYNESRDCYCLQDGHRRWLASGDACLDLVPVVWVASDGFFSLLDTGDRLDVRDLVFRALGLSPTGPKPECND